MEVIELKFFKYLAIYSAVIGGVSAILSLIPPVMPFLTLFFLPFAGTVAPFVLLIKKDGFYSKENKTYAILGAISGFFISLSFLVVFVPAVFLIHLIFKNYYDYGIQFLNLFLFALFFIMTATVYITSNTAVGLIFGVIYKYVKER